MVKDQYHSLFKGIHWITALIVLGLLSVGFIMTSMEFSPLKLNIYMLHKSFGMTVLGLVIIRIIWRIFVKSPKSLDTHAKWEKYLSKLIHFLLYYGLIAMPMSGWAMSSAAEYPVNLFGLFDFPAITPKDEETYTFLKFVHETGAYALICAIGLHFLGAAKHHIIDKDITLTRMGGNFGFLLIGGLLLLSATALAGNHILKDLMRDNPAQISSETSEESSIEQVAESNNAWLINKEQSSINFQFTQYGSAVNGSFGEFDGDIIFDPEDLENSSADITVSINSITTGSADRDAQAKNNEWFAAQEFPQARFIAESFSESGEGEYVADGFLTIRGHEAPLSLPFSLEIAENSDGQKTAEMRAQITLNRQDFGIGQGQWESEEAIENTVKIDISITALQSLKDAQE